jgi:hypothetical protein
MRLIIEKQDQCTLGLGRFSSVEAVSFVGFLDILAVHSVALASAGALFPIVVRLVGT